MSGAMLRVIRGLPRTGPRWLVYCNVCAEFPFSIRPIRTSQRHDLAVVWAHQHAKRHRAEQCPTCERMGRISDDSTQVALGASP